MGGGLAGLVAVMLRCHQQLPAEARHQVRAVCFAPAAVMDVQLTTMCRSFVASVIWVSDAAAFSELACQVGGPSLCITTCHESASQIKRR